MRIEDASICIEDEIDGAALLKKLEAAGRTCYRSEGLADDDSAPRFISSLIERGHDSVLEHEKVTVRVVCDRGVSHEIVRHRIGSYSQESTRYCNYAQDKFGSQITCIRPLFWPTGSELFETWKASMLSIEAQYFELLSMGAKPEEARTVLPNSLRTEIVATYNMREWRHFLRMRADARAHPQMREVAKMILVEFLVAMPVLFDDLRPLLEDHPAA